MVSRAGSAAVLAALLVSFGLAQPQADIETKADALLAKMTLEEKIGQLVQYADLNPAHQAEVRRGWVGSLLNVRGAAAVNAAQKAAKESRLGIPLLLGYDVVHGYRTIFPIPLAEACTWDPALVEKAAAVAARETAAVGVRWTFAPMVDIARDARWGRIAEGSGEDPYLGSIMATARVRGFQGAALSAPDSVLACAKHYVAYGAAEAGRDYNTVDISEKTLREVYLPPFKAALDAGAATFMSAFNDLNGVPASANPYTLTGILRGEWKFAGFVVSDWNSVAELMAHGLASGPADAARAALEAGVDMDMVSGLYMGNLEALVKAGEIPEQRITEAARRILRVKQMLGLFENPFVDPEREKSALLTRDNVAAALEVARKSIVLLKNANNLLPLAKDNGSIAVIGPLADDTRAPLGPWSADGKAEEVVSVLDGMRAKLGATARLQYVQGCEISHPGDEAFADAIKAAREADVTVFVGGEAADMSGEAGSRASLDLPGRQNDLLKALHATGKPIVLVILSGRPLSLPWAAENVPAILQAWFLGITSGTAIADTLFGDSNPSGKLVATFPYHVGQEPLYYAHKSTGRPSTRDKFSSRYIDVPWEPLFPFGFGLSFTTFKYANLRVSAPSINVSGQTMVSADVQNTGKWAGEEIVQLYVRDLVASTTRPVKELKGFKRISLAPGETKRAEFPLAAQDLAFYGRNMKWTVEPGAFQVWVGPNSSEGLQGSFEVTR